MTEESLHFSASGLTLEGILAYDEALSPDSMAILCPPHPQLMGNMDNNVIRAVSDELVRRGWATFRFNYRGVGKSEYPGGNHLPSFEYWEAMAQSRNYAPVQADFESMPAFVCGLGFPVRRLAVVGYSFGAYVGSRGGCREDGVRDLVLIAPPFPNHDFSFLSDCRKRKLILAGDDDFVFPEKDFTVQAAFVADPEVVLVMPGADHFFMGRDEEVARRVGEFLA